MAMNNSSMGHFTRVAKVTIFVEEEGGKTYTVEVDRPAAAQLETVAPSYQDPWATQGGRNYQVGSDEVVLRLRHPRETKVTEVGHGPSVRFTDEARQWAMAALPYGKEITRDDLLNRLATAYEAGADVAARLNRATVRASGSMISGSMTMPSGSVDASIMASLKRSYAQKIDADMLGKIGGIV